MVGNVFEAVPNKNWRLMSCKGLELTHKCAKTTETDIQNFSPRAAILASLFPRPNDWELAFQIWKSSSLVFSEVYLFDKPLLAKCEFTKTKMLSKIIDENGYYSMSLQRFVNIFAIVAATFTNVNLDLHTNPCSHSDFLSSHEGALESITMVCGKGGLYKSFARKFAYEN